jgi:hypothetical protein
LAASAWPWPAARPTASAPAKTSYSLGRGTASYDQLRRDSEICAADGGKIEAKQDGGDPTQLSNYTCVIPKGGK